MQEIYTALNECLTLADPETKAAATLRLWQDWCEMPQRFTRDPASSVPSPEPGRPARPVLVDPRALHNRDVTHAHGHASMLHALCHIEFTAINLALDAACRFRDLPDPYLVDWLKVAADEARHFRLLRQRLKALGHDYGDFPAHDGLWDMARRTSDDALVRMALVPRLLEARGLDATPPIMDKLARIGDHEALDILEVILRDEITHVRIGDHWFRYLCACQGLEPEAHYRVLIARHGAPRPQRPVNEKARLAAGFSSAELEALLQR